MIEFGIFGISIKLKFMFIAGITLFLIIDKTGIATLTLIASIIHELGHVLMFVLLGYKPNEISFEIIGIKIIQKNNIQYFREIIILLAGPLSNIVMFFILNIYFSKIYKLNIFAYTHLFIGLFNLIPVGSLDGGKILNCIFKNTCNEYLSNLISITISIIFLSIMIILSLYLAIYKNNFSMVMTSTYLLIMLMFNKYD